MACKPVTETERKVIGFLMTPTPHPDGKPWGKCCGEANDTDCMCLMRKPRNEPSRFNKILKGLYNPVDADGLARLAMENGRFFCMHRKTDDGFHRECAGWAAKFHPETRK